MRRSPDISILKNLLAYEALSTGLGGGGNLVAGMTGDQGRCFFGSAKAPVAEGGFAGVVRAGVRGVV